MCWSCKTLQIVVIRTTFLTNYFWNKSMYYVYILFPFHYYCSFFFTHPVYSNEFTCCISLTLHMIFVGNAGKLILTPKIYFKGTVNDSLGLRKIFKPLRNKEKNTDNLNMYHFSSKNCINLTEKWLFIRYYSMGLEHCFSPWENFPKFLDKILCFSFNKTHKTT